MRYLHVPRRRRLNSDEGPESVALDENHPVESFDKDEVRNAGEVVSRDDLA